MAKTQWQKQQAKQAAASAASGHAKATLAAPSLGGQPWYVTLIEVLESIWAALPASQSEPNHPVAQKLSALKQSLPK